MTRRNRALVIMAIGILAVGTLVMAGPGGPGGQGSPRGHRGHGGMGPGGGMAGPFGPLGRALQQLDLSEEQRTQIDTLVDAARPQMHALREQLREARQAFRESHPPTEFDEAAIRAQVAEQSAVMAELAVLRAKLRSDVLGLLTPEQLAELEALRAKHQEWRQMRHEFWGGGS